MASMRVLVALNSSKARRYRLDRLCAYFASCCESTCSSAVSARALVFLALQVAGVAEVRAEDEARRPGRDPESQAEAEAGASD
jgi:hypothetical protein